MSVQTGIKTVPLFLLNYYFHFSPHKTAAELMGCLLGDLFQDISSAADDLCINPGTMGCSRTVTPAVGKDVYLTESNLPDHATRSLKILLFLSGETDQAIRGDRDIRRGFP